MDNTENVSIKLLQNMKEITDFDASELDVYARLTEAQLLNKDHPEKGLFIAESPKVITRALDGGYEPVSVLVEKKQALEDAETIAVLERCGNIPVYTAEFAVLTRLTDIKNRSFRDILFSDHGKFDTGKLNDHLKCPLNQPQTGIIHSFFVDFADQPFNSKNRNTDDQK